MSACFGSSVLGRLEIIIKASTSYSLASYLTGDPWGKKQMNRKRMAKTQIRGLGLLSSCLLFVPAVLPSPERKLSVDSTQTASRIFLSMKGTAVVTYSHCSLYFVCDDSSFSRSPSRGACSSFRAYQMSKWTAQH